MEQIPQENLLNLNTLEMNTLKCCIIEDRNYDIPDWFYQYINDNVLTQLLQNIRLAELTPESSNNLKRMIQTLEKKSMINYKSLVVTMLESTDNHMISLLIYFDYNKVTKYMRGLVEFITIDQITSWIVTYMNNSIVVPSPVIHLYLSKAISPRWRFRSVRRIMTVLDDLYDITISRSKPDSHNYIFPTIHDMNPAYVDRSDVFPSSREYWCEGGTYLPEHASLDIILQYLSLYEYNKLEHDLPKYISTLLQKYDSKANELTRIDINSCKTLILSSLKRNANNIRLVYWYLNPEDMNIVTDHIIQSNVPLRSYKYYENLVHKPLPPEKTLELVESFIKRGGDVTTLQIGFLRRFLNQIIVQCTDQKQFDALVRLNPDVSNTYISISFREYLSKHIHEYTPLIQLKIVRSFCQVDIYKVIPNEIRDSIFKFVTKEWIYNEYPKLISYDKTLDMTELLELLDKNSNLLEYMNPGNIPQDIIIQHIYRKGYIPLNYDIQSIGVNQYIQLHLLASLISNTGVGYGYILDCWLPIYRNSLIQACISFMKE